MHACLQLCEALLTEQEHSDLADRQLHAVLEHSSSSTGKALSHSLAKELSSLSTAGSYPPSHQSGSEPKRPLIVDMSQSAAVPPSGIPEVRMLADLTVHRDMLIFMVLCIRPPRQHDADPPVRVQVSIRLEPTCVVVELQLQLAAKASDLDIDVVEGQLVVTMASAAGAAQVATAVLPCQVDSQRAAATLDKKKRVLTVRLPIL